MGSMVLDRFVEEHGQLPLYNRISGRRPTKHKMANDEVVPISIVVRLLKKASQLSIRVVDGIARSTITARTENAKHS